MAAIPVINGILGEILVIIAIFLVIYVIFKLGKFLAGLIINVILGFISIVVLNAWFALDIPWDLVVIVITALLGLVGVAIIVILKLIGITL